MKTSPLQKPRSAYACGTETHDRIINAAIEVFGERGFDASSTREIARRAGVASPLLGYYFENKEGLYRACAATIHARSRDFFDSLFESIEHALASNVSPKKLLALFDALVRLSLDFLLADEEALRLRLFVAQEHAGNGLAGIPDETLLQYRMVQMRLFTRLVAALCSVDEDHPEMRIRSLTLQGQINIFYTFRLPALNMLTLEQFNCDALKQIGDIVIANMHTLISAWKKQQKVKR